MLASAGQAGGGGDIEQHGAATPNDATTTAPGAMDARLADGESNPTAAAPPIITGDSAERGSSASVPTAPTPTPTPAPTPPPAAIASDRDNEGAAPEPIDIAGPTKAVDQRQTASISEPAGWQPDGMQLLADGMEFESDGMEFLSAPPGSLRLSLGRGLEIPAPPAAGGAGPPDDPRRPGEMHPPLPSPQPRNADQAEPYESLPRPQPARDDLL